MGLEAKRIKISIGGITVEAELKPTRTAMGCLLYTSDAADE